MVYRLLLILTGLQIGTCYNNYNDNNGYFMQNQKYCDDLSPYYGDLNLDQIAGVWYVMEKIPHTYSEYRTDRSLECFQIDIRELNVEPTPPTPYPPLTNSPYGNQLSYGTQLPFGYTEQFRIRHFVLEWYEGLIRDDYHIRVNTSRKGFWPTDIPNKSVENQYRFFGGVIQVLAVASNHLVLNFCMRLPHSQLFSVVLARNPNQLTTEDLAFIHNIFTNKRLSMSTLQRVCTSSATTFYVSSVAVVVGSIVMWLRSAL